MKITLNWLKQYVAFDGTPSELADRLTMLGLEVEGVQTIAGDFEGVVVAEVLTREKHPNADKLSVCRVRDGKGERQIVCGAQNFKAGDKVPLVLPGSTLPSASGQPPLTIKVGKIRGVESHGMMCSPRELGLAEDADGLLILPENAVVGQSFAQHLGRASGDVVYDLEITPNRPDLNSLIGIAREIAAVTGQTLRWPQLPAESTLAEVPLASDFVNVRIEAPDLCPRYTARVIRGVNIGPSPEWLRQTLERVGIRSINNVVDVTNFVMLETGQPIHAFDLSLIARDPSTARSTIIIRRAQPDESFITLDGQARKLNESMLVIADPLRAVALAGVMGGQNSEIKDTTTDVVLESANFRASNVRYTSKHLGLKTDASYRFERGADIAMADWASLRAIQLFQQTAGGNPARGVVDACPGSLGRARIALRHRKVASLLGIDIPVEEQLRYLTRLELEPEAAPAPAASEKSTFLIPTFRVDLKRETDLIEEIARLYGVDRIPSTPPRGAIGSHAYDSLHDQLAEARRILIGLGLCEAQGQTLISDQDAALAASLVPGLAPIPLSHPLSSDMNTLRPGLTPGLLDSLRNNVRHRNTDAALFESGRVFFLQNQQQREERRLAIALTGRRNPVFWSGVDRDALCDLADLKGILEEFMDHFGVRGVQFVRQDQPPSLFLEAAQILLGKQAVGIFGQISPPLAKARDLRDPVLVVELNLDLMLARRNASRSFKSLPAFPAIRRDVALVVPEATTHEAVLAAVRQARPPFLEQVELFDLFRGKHVPAGAKSLAYGFVYRNAERTLTDAEVNAVHEKLVSELTKRLSATVRS